MAKSRRANDWYPTPKVLTQALVVSVPNISGYVYEACAGDGAIAKVLAESPGVTRVHTNDIDPQWATDTTDDATQTCPHGIQWAITNPPFSHAAAILAVQLRALQAGHIRTGIAMLLRLSFLEPCVERATKVDRGAQSLPDMLIVLPRTSFTGDGKTDSVTCAWMVWHADHQVRPYSLRRWTKTGLQALEALKGR